MTKKHSVLLFDLGGVLVDGIHFQEWRKLLGDWKSSDDELKTSWALSAACIAHEIGEISSEEFAVRLVDEFSLSVDAAHILRVFPTWVFEFTTGVDQVLSDLRDRYVTACLSNTNALHWKPHWAAAFDHAFLSFQIGIVKPDAAIFDHVLQELDCPASDVTYFDDSTINVEAARQRGIDAHLTIGFQEVRRKLQALGHL